MVTTLRISAVDGYALGATRYGNQSSGPYVVLNGATAVKQSFYTRFASWFALRGFTVLTYDYRGIGESRPARLERFEARMRDWGELDFEGVLRFALLDKGSRPLAVIGHSVGGQLLGFARSNGEIERVVTVASQGGFWGHWSGLSAWRMAATWYGVIPALSAFYGYVPGRFGLGADLPGGVAQEWAAWGRHRDSFFGHGVSREGFSRLRAPVLSVSLADDGYAPRAGVDWLHACFENATVERVHVAPRDLGVRSVGHFGFFRPAVEESLWLRASAFLAPPVSSGAPRVRAAS